VKKWILIGIAVVVLAVVVISILRGNRVKEYEVEMAGVKRKNLVATVTASGTIHPKRSVDVSANTMGRVTSLAIREGDTVQAGEFLLEIDPTEFRSTVRALEAAVRTSQADLTLAEAAAEKADQDLRRARELHQQGLVSEEQLEAARTESRVQSARVEAARSRLLQQEANLEKARYDLDKVTVTAPMSGIVTRLNVEEGETAVVGTMNNAGTVLLTIADLSIIETEIEVDETDIPFITPGLPAKITIDALPDREFTGRVTEVGNSPIQAGAAAQQRATNFKVVVTIDGEVPGVRPGFTCTAVITTATRQQVPAIPIQAMTVREFPVDDEGNIIRSRRNAGADSGRPRAAEAEPESEQTMKEFEGAFVVEDGNAVFKSVKVGIAGERHFEVLSGLSVGDVVITGPFQSVRNLRDGDAVESAPSSRSGAGPPSR